MDCYEFICGLALLSHGSLNDKAEIICGLYDFDKSRLISKDELVVLIKTTMTSLNAMTSQQEISISFAEKKTSEILQKYDTNKDGEISLKEFQSFVSKDPEILRYLYNYGVICKDDLRPDFGGSQGEIPDADSDLENEINKNNDFRDERIERIKSGIEHNVKNESEDALDEVFSVGKKRK